MKQKLLASIRKDALLYVVLVAAGVYGLVRVLTAEHPTIEAFSLIVYLASDAAVVWWVRRRGWWW